VARWGGAAPQYCGDCASGPCRLYVGDKHITITPIDAELKVTPSASAVTPGTAVTFTATVTPGSVDGLAMPIRMQWRWVPDSGSTSTPCAPPPWNTTPVTCTFTPPGSGVMYVDAVVNTVSLTTGAYVSVVACLQGDSIADNDQVRTALRNAYNLAVSESKERGGWIYRDSETGQYYVWDSGDLTGRSSCHYDTPNPAPEMPGFPTAVGIAPWHVHPIPAGQAIPGDCPLYEPGARAGAGPSVFDRKAAHSWDWSNPPNGCTWP